MTTNNFKPILFNTEMVQAILAGRKTQTRRIQGLSKYNRSPNLYGIGNVRINGYFNFYRIEDEKGYWETPKFETGDILWVRETFIESKTPDIPNNRGWSFSYKADGGYGIIKWKPSLFMPKEAARIFLKLTNVRCERLQDISDNDAIGEGIDFFNHGYGGSPVGIWYKNYKFGTNNCSPNYSFQTLWDSINAKKQPWESNPWVWVYDFERIEKPENFLS